MSNNLVPKDFLNLIILSDISSESTVKFSSYHSALGLLVSYLLSSSSFNISLCLGDNSLITPSITFIPSSVTLPDSSLKAFKVIA